MIWVLDASIAVKWFTPDKGFGFVELADGSGDAFLHVAVLQAAGYDAVAAQFEPGEVAALLALIVTINAWNAIGVTTRT